MKYQLAKSLEESRQKLITDNHYTLFSYQNTPGSMIHKTGKFITVFGEDTITIDEKDITKKETTLNILSIFGSTIVYVPEDLIIVNCVKHIVGEVSIHRRLKNNNDFMKQKTLIINGITVVGEIIIKTKKEKLSLKTKISNMLKYFTSG